MAHFDAIIIGTGQAGPSLAQRLTTAGMRIAVVERKFFGGTCVNTGCIPTKAMVASAYAARLAQRAGEYGVRVEGKPSVDMKAVKARKDEISGRSRTGVESWLRSMERCTVLQGHARFESARQVRVGDEVLSGERIFINVGGRATIPEISGLDKVAYLTNSSLMHVDFLPRHLVVLGGSYIGLEFGQMFRRFGSEVTVIEAAPRLISQEDKDISEAVAAILRAESLDLRLQAKVSTCRPHKDGVAVDIESSAGAQAVVGSHLLLAIGRRPNTDDLGLENAGIKTDEHGYIVVDDELKTSVPGIWALGDCNGKGAFTHTSYNDFEIVAANLLDNDRRRVSDRITAYNLYIDPPLGRAGMTDTEVRHSGRRALVAQRPMERVSRAVEKGETQGLMKITVDAESKQILGAAILGTGGDEVIHAVLDLM